MLYKRKPQTVLAHHYTAGQRFIDLPQWAKDFKLQHGADLATLHIEPFQKRIWVPTRDGHTFACLGDWLFIVDDVIRVIPDAAFQRLYEPAETTEPPPE